MISELIQPGPAEALAGLIGVPMPEEELPLFWHWLYMLERPAQADLGPDGHPVRAHPRPARARPAPHVGGRPCPLRRAAALRRGRDPPQRDPLDARTSRAAPAG